MSSDVSHYTLEDEVQDRKHDVTVRFHSAALVIEVDDHPEVYIGVEVWDGALRGLFGEDAEVVMNDPGVIVQERFGEASS